MPESPLPEEADNLGPEGLFSREIFMRWRRSADPEEAPELLEISVGTGWAATDLGRHLLAGIVDVDFEAPDDIVENVMPDPPGTPIALGAGHQVLRTCEFGGALFDE